MLIKITRYDELDGPGLMRVYAESNRDNAFDLYPDEPDKAKALRAVETGFLAFLKDEFFAREGSVYWILEEDGRWLSALRSARVRPGLFYLEALETRPDGRRAGAATRLLGGVLACLKEEGAFRACDCVGKTNAASLKTHAACGFQIVSETGYDYLRETENPRAYGLEYRYGG